MSTNSSAARSGRRPPAGDLISYLPAKDARGRLQAREIRHSGQKIEPRRTPSRIPRATIGIAALATVIAVAAAGLVPSALAGLTLALSVVSYFAYLLDKTSAGKGATRTPEKTLHLFDLLGGWPGALIAQQQFRHKTSKRSFQLLFWVTVVLNLVGAWWLVASGNAVELSTLLDR